MSRIPAGAFEYYVALGESRSFDAVAKHYGVNKRSVTRAAKRDAWTERLERIEQEAKVRVDERLTTELEEMGLRHRKLLRAMASRAAQAIATYPLTDGMQGIKAAEIAVKLERILAGEPSERTAQTIVDVTRQEVRELLEPVPAPRDAEDDSAANGKPDASAE